MYAWVAKEAFGVANNEIEGVARSHDTHSHRRLVSENPMSERLTPTAHQIVLLALADARLKASTPNPELQFKFSFIQALQTQAMECNNAN